jgi:hypothetical protein
VSSATTGWYTSANSVGRRPPLSPARGRRPGRGRQTGDGAGEVPLERLLVHGGVDERRVEHRVAPLPLRLGVVHRRVGVAQQRVGIAGRLGEGDPDARPHARRRRAARRERHRGAQRADDPLGDRLGVARPAHVLEQDGELVPAEARDRVAPARRVQEA